MATHTPTKRRSRYQRATRPVPHVLSARDRDILAALATYPFMATEQVCRYVFGSLKPLQYCRVRLRKLWDARLVDRLFVRSGPHGSPRTVYTLKRRNPVQRSPYFLEHTLATLDFILAVRAYCQGRDDLELAQVVLERELRREPVRVREGSRAVPVVPDCYLQLTWHCNGRAYTLPLALELDRGTQASRVWRAKVRRYLAFVARGYPERFGTHALTVVVLTTAGPKRLRTLVQAIEGELTRLGQRQQADLFRIASADLAREEPREVLARPRFSVPFQQGAVPLLPEE